MSGLDEGQRKALAPLVTTARTTLYGDAQRTLRGSYGILPDGTLQNASGLAATPALRARRATLEAVIGHLRADGTSVRAAVERLTREVAFTHLNRLLAIRVADALGVIAPSLRDGQESSGFRQWINDLAPSLATADDTGGYWTYLSQCADELAADAPALFDPRNPLLALRPSKAAIDTVVALLAAQDNADIWSADDTFGWAYQFFNTRDERQEMRAESAAPRDSRELAVRNQFFTPDYVVRFLVHNTLGRRLVDANPATELLDQLDLLIDPPTTQGAPLDLDQVKVLDPACGSGHFLLGCYDVLEAAWALNGVPADAAAAHIVPCLWGIDIDPRAVQVAQSAVIFRARRACGRAPLPPPNIVCARALPEDDIAWEHAQVGLGDDLRQLVTQMRTALRDAPVLGPLVKAEQRLQREIRNTVAGTDDTGDSLFATAGIAHDSFGNAERAVITALQRAADTVTATPAERLLAARASDAVRFLDAVRHRYDAVLMNPPFGEPVPATKDYLKGAYPWIPTKDYNLLAAFVGRGLDLCKADGYTGAITSRAGMFLKTFEAWRTQVLLGHRIVALADLGYGVMEEALVEAAAYVVSPAPPTGNHAATFIRLLKDSDRPRALQAAVSASRDGQSDHRLFRVLEGDLSVVPGSPLAYWMGTSIRRLFAESPRLEGHGAEVRQGVATADDFRFVRLFWEVSPEKVAKSREETLKGGRWVPFAKGGDYSPYWYDIHLVVDWADDGRGLREFGGSVVRNPQHYFSVGLTWPAHTISGFGPRVLPAGTIFGHASGTLLTDKGLLLLGWLMTRTGRSCVDVFLAAGDEVSAGGAKKKYEVGVIQNTPCVLPMVEQCRGLVESVTELIRLSQIPDFYDETSRRFMGPRSLDIFAGFGSPNDYRSETERFGQILRITKDVELLIDDAIGLDVAGRTYVDGEFGAHVLDYPRSDSAALRGIELYANLSDDQLSDAAVRACGGARYLSQKVFYADRRVEVIAHALRINAEDILNKLASLPPPDWDGSRMRDLVSYCIGVAFGRWDARGPRQMVAFDPLAQVPSCPPAMLVSESGLLASIAPVGYPVAIPDEGILVDEPGQPLDLAALVEAAAGATVPGGAGLLDDAIAVLGRRSLREYLAKGFFKDHVSRYSKSRRQAPIYWQLTLRSGRWSVWLYAPRFSREMLYAVVAVADRRRAVAEERATVLRDDETMSARERQKSIDAERTLGAELQEFRDDIARLASLGWQPDLDDGYVLCAAPLGRWFPTNTWKQLGEQLSAIKKGSYPWAAVHQYRDAL